MSPIKPNKMPKPPKKMPSQPNFLFLSSFVLCDLTKLIMQSIVANSEQGKSVSIE
jgi:hypothetical protein